MTNAPVFRPAHADRPATPPIPFGIELPDGTVVEFLIPTPVPFFPATQLAAAADSDDPRVVFASFHRFILGVLDPAEANRFAEALTLARWEAADILPLVQYLVVQAVGTGHPSPPPSSSSASPADSHRSSPAADGSPVPTPTSTPTPPPPSWPVRSPSASS